MIDRAKNLGAAIVALGTATLLLGTLGTARAASKRPINGKPRTAQPRVSKRTAAPTKSQRASAHSRRRAKRPSFGHRLARLKMEPQRAEEIQRALIAAGFLDQEPNGKYDDATREAMRRYQAAHNLPPTGLPEAKTLMKLGLGPHPLPEELDPSAQARASADTLDPYQPPANNSTPEAAAHSASQESAGETLGRRLPQSY